MRERPKNHPYPRWVYALAGTIGVLLLLTCLLVAFTPIAQVLRAETTPRPLSTDEAQRSLHDYLRRNYEIENTPFTVERAEAMGYRDITCRYLLRFSTPDDTSAMERAIRRCATAKKWDIQDQATPSADVPWWPPTAGATTTTFSVRFYDSFSFCPTERVVRIDLRP